jgi:hypothetical protein
VVDGMNMTNVFMYRMGQQDDADSTTSIEMSIQHHANSVVPVKKLSYTNELSAIHMENEALNGHVIIEL